MSEMWRIRLDDIRSTGFSVGGFQRMLELIGFLHGQGDGKKQESTAPRLLRNTTEEEEPTEAATTGLLLKMPRRTLLFRQFNQSSVASGVVHLHSLMSWAATNLTGLLERHTQKAVNFQV